MSYRQATVLLSALIFGLVPLSDSAQARTVAGCLFSEYLPAIAEITYTYWTTDNLSDTKTGTGFLINPEGSLLTAAHVVSPPPGVTAAKEEVKVRTGNRTDTVDANIESRDANRDIAILGIPKELGKKWPTVPLDKSPSIQPGDTVHALGFPGGFDATVTPPGIVTSLNARIEGSLKPWMQTSLDLEEGMSGGPVFDSSGRVVGISVRRHEKLTDIAYVLSTEKMKDIMAIAGDDWLNKSLPCTEQSSLTENETWSTAEKKSKKLGGEDKVYCFLTEVWGVFNHESDSVQIKIDDKGQFVLSGTEAGGGQHGASARCMSF